MKASRPRLIVAGIFAAGIIAWFELLYFDIDYRTKFLVRTLYVDNPVLHKLFQATNLDNYIYRAFPAPEDQIKPLVDLLADPDSNVRYAAIQSLYEYTGEKDISLNQVAEENLEALIADPDPEISRGALALLAGFRDQHNIQLLEDAVNDTKLPETTRASAIASLAETGDPQSLDQVISYVFLPSTLMRRTAIAVLGYYDDARALELIGWFLASGEENDFMRAKYAAVIYGERHNYIRAPGIFQPLLLKGVQRTTYSLYNRCQIAEALPDPAKAVAYELILTSPGTPNPDEQYRFGVRNDLKEMRSSAKTILPILKQTLQDPNLDPHIRKATEKAITDLDNQTPSDALRRRP